MPRHIIHVDHWDEFQTRLKREHDERVVAVLQIVGQPEHLEVLTDSLHDDGVETR